MVTNLQGDPQELYDKVYCGRGEMENRIKEQMQLFSERTSAHKWWANQWRLLLSGLSYTLMEALRRFALKGTKWARLQCHSLRLKLIKIGAVIVRNTRTIHFHLSESYPWAPVFSTMRPAGWCQPKGRIGAAPGATEPMGERGKCLYTLKNTSKSRRSAQNTKKSISISNSNNEPNFTLHEISGLDADHAIMADFAASASEAGTLNGLDSAEFLLKNDHDTSPVDGIIDLADFAQTAGDAGTLDGLSRADFARDIHTHADVDLSDNVPLLNANNNFISANTFSAGSMTLGGDPAFTLQRPVNASNSPGTNFIIQGQDAGITEGPLNGGDIDLNPGAASNSGVDGLINLNGDSNVTGDLSVSGSITGDLTGTADNATSTDFLDGLDSSEFLLKNDHDTSPTAGLIDQAEFAFSAANADFALEADHAIMVDFAASASEAGTLNGLDSSEFLLKNIHDTSPSDGIIDTAEFAFSADFASLATDADFALEADHAITADFAASASEAGTLNGLDSSEFLIRADEDVSPDNGIIDRADFAFNADHATNADFLGGLEANDFLDKTTYDNDANSEVDDSSLSGNVALLDESNDFIQANTFSASTMTVGDGANPFNLTRPTSTSGDGTSLVRGCPKRVIFARAFDRRSF